MMVPVVQPNYWLDLFTGTSWNEFLAAGGDVSGFRSNRWTSVQKVKPGDRLLCYLTGVSRFVGILEVTGPAYRDTAPIWTFDEFPSRLPVRIVQALTPETAVPVLELRDRLSIFKNLKNPNVWQGAVRGSPYRWKAEDGLAVEQAVAAAAAAPIVRPVDAARLARRPAVLTSRQVGEVTVPEDDENDDENDDERRNREGSGRPEPVSVERDASAHTEMQWLLLKFGSDMGLNVWAARGDRGREWQGQRFDALPNFLSELPLPFDEATNRIIENIDVLWLSGNSFQAAFEIERTTSIYSGLLRMSDLLAMQPNLNIPLFLVAPDERRSKVISEVNRATFSRLTTPLVEVCRFIPFSSLRSHVANVGPYLRYLRPEVLQELSESCEPET